MTPTIGTQTPSDQIRPFKVNVPEAKIAKLRSRIDATEWPDRETVADESQGVQLATMQELARYWATDYDWRKCEAKFKLIAEFHDRDRWVGHSFHSRSTLFTRGSRGLQATAQIDTQEVRGQKSDR
jgi:Epoxide hydrolase N terminus